MVYVELFLTFGVEKTKKVCKYKFFYYIMWPWQLRYPRMADITHLRHFLINHSSKEKITYHDRPSCMVGIIFSFVLHIFTNPPSQTSLTRKELTLVKDSWGIRGDRYLDRRVVPLWNHEGQGIQTHISKEISGITITT